MRWLWVCCLLLVGCRTVRVVEQVPMYVKDTVSVVKVERDSVYVDRWHTEYQRGDTVFVVDEVMRDRVVVRVDTAYRYVERPVEVVVEREVEVRKPLPWYKKGLMWVGVLGLVVNGLWLWNKFR